MKTLHGEQAHYIRIKGSKFIAVAFPISSEDDFNRKYKTIQQTYPKASHYCYAYLIEDLHRCSDDGEPSSTAGQPILRQLFNSNLKYAAIVVIRYFGGTLLGASGLQRAYRDAAKEVLIRSYIIEKRINVSMLFDWNHLDNVMKSLKSYEDLDFLQKDISNRCHIRVLVTERVYEELREKLQQIIEIYKENKDN